MAKAKPKRSGAVKRFGLARPVTDVPFPARKMLVGTNCPSCEQHVQMYLRKLNRSMVRQLAWLCSRFSTNGGRWVVLGAAAPRWMIRTPQLSILKHWGLIERKQVEDSKKRTSGTYRPTETGLDFIGRRIAVPGEVFMYNDVVRAWGVDLVTVTDVVDGFDYGELMDRGIALLDVWPKGTITW